jgi:hypothetical protein
MAHGRGGDDDQNPVHCEVAGRAHRQLPHGGNDLESVAHGPCVRTTAAVTLFDIQPRLGGGTNFSPIANVPTGVQVAPSPTGNAGRVGATQYIEVTYRGDTGFADASNLRPVAVGAETLDLPVPMIHTVTNQAGSTMLRNATAGPTAANTLLLPLGTRVTTTRCMRPTPTLPGHYEGTVVDGPHTGTQGFFDISDLTLERLGTR